MDGALETVQWEAVLAEGSLREVAFVDSDAGVYISNRGASVDHGVSVGEAGTVARFGGAGADTRGLVAIVDGQFYQAEPLGFDVRDVLGETTEFDAPEALATDMLAAWGQGQTSGFYTSDSIGEYDTTLQEWTLYPSIGGFSRRIDLDDGRTLVPVAGVRTVGLCAKTESSPCSAIPVSTPN